METTTKIDVGTGPEAMVDVNGELWVANSGGFGNDSIISVIDPAQETVIKSIEVGHVPKDFVIDAEGDVWVLCIGNIKYDENYNVVSETPSKLFEISPVDYEIKSEVKLFDKKHPGHLEISDEKNTLYVGGSFGFTGIYTMSTGADALNVEPLIDSKSFYGISVHPETGEIYGLEAPSFKSGGDFYIYSESGTEKAKYSVDIGPNAILF